MFDNDLILLCNRLKRELLSFPFPLA
jgi:hypothetical protein